MVPPISASDTAGSWRRGNALAVVLAIAVIVAFAAILPRLSARHHHTLPVVRPAAPSVPRLVVLPVDGTTAATPSTATFDFGIVDPFETHAARHVFTLRNVSKAPVTIERLQPSCGCESVAFVGSGPPRSSGMTVPPGERASIQVGINLANIGEAPAHKSVIVYLRGEAAPACTLGMTLRGHPLVVFSPPRLDFGRLATLHEKRLNLTVGVDRRLAARGKSWRLVCPDPDVRVELVTRHGPATGNLEMRDYTVVIPRTTRVGLIRQGVSVMAAGMPAPPGMAHPMREQPLGTALLTGEVVGRISAIPTMAIFSSSNVTDTVTRELGMLGQTPRLLRHAQCVAGARYVSAKVAPMRSSSGPAARGSGGYGAKLSITLKPGRPPGTIQTTVTVIAADGERLLIPVIAFSQASNPVRR